MSKLLYFAYGSNLHPKWLNHRVTSALPVSNTSLNNWKLCFHKRSDDNSAKCNIIKTDLNDDVVHGTIIDYIKSFKAINDPNTNRDKEKRSIAWPK